MHRSRHETKCSTHTAVPVGSAMAGFGLMQARSSVGEHYLDAVGVGGSIPPVPTSFCKLVTSVNQDSGTWMGSEVMGADVVDPLIPMPGYPQICKEVCHR